MFNRLRQAITSSFKPLVHSVQLEGGFDIIGSRCVGRVRDLDRSRETFNIVVEARGAYILKEIRTLQTQRESYAGFAFLLDDSITAKMLLLQEARIFAENSSHVRYQLKLNGATELALIREFIGTPREKIFDIDFTKDGNADSYLNEGWSYGERDFRWTDGPKAILTVECSISSIHRYEAILKCQPFVAPPHVNSQYVGISLNGYYQTINVEHGTLGFFSILFNKEKLKDSDCALFEFSLPDAGVPADLGRGGDRRNIALAVRELSFSRLLDE